MMKARKGDPGWRLEIGEQGPMDKVLVVVVMMVEE